MQNVNCESESDKISPCSEARHIASRESATCAVTGRRARASSFSKSESRIHHAKNRYHCNTPSTTRPREARVAKSGILPAERARLARKKEKAETPAGRRGSRARHLTGAGAQRITGRERVASRVLPVMSPFLTQHSPRRVRGRNGPVMSQLSP